MLAPAKGDVQDIPFLVIVVLDLTHSSSLLEELEIGGHDELLLMHNSILAQCGPLVKARMGERMVLRPQCSTMPSAYGQLVGTSAALPPVLHHQHDVHDVYPAFILALAYVS
jgi:hypothetical protein